MLTLPASPCRGEEPSHQNISDAPSSPWEIIFAGGTTGTLIILLLVALSVVALALVVEHLLTIRRDTLIPAGLATKVQERLASSDAEGAEKVCRDVPSALSVVIRSGLIEAPGGWLAVEKGMEDALAEESARLLRKIDYLSVIGNIAPMIGLLGTVVGMIFAFQEVADTQGAARAAELASGIYQALVTTVGGLVVAIPSLAAFAIFRNRIDGIISETGGQAMVAMAPIKREHQLRTTSSPPAPPPPARSP